MQNWAKRGLQTALVTGGLLMLGTGIASADEKDINPDAPASPLDGSLTIPVDIGDNAIGTPNGQLDLPEHKKVYSSKSVTDPAKAAVESMSSKASSLPGGDQVTAATDKVSEASQAAAAAQQKVGQATPAQAKKATSKAATESDSDDEFRGNRGSIDLVVPVQIANNALSLFGDAEVSGNDHEQTYEGGEGVTTSGSGDSLAGNVVDVDYALPIQIANNAGGIGGDATSSGNTATQETKVGGHSATDGSGGVLAGNIIAPQGATPVQVNNNAAVLGGTAESSDNTSSSKAHSGGSLLSNGADGVGSGNVAGVPLALPVEANNSALSGLGIADSSGNANTAEAKGGDTRHGTRTRTTYAETNGDGGVASGNLAQPQVAGDVAGHGVAGAAGGISAVGGGESRSTSANSNETSSEAGGYSNTSGVDSVIGGNVADVAVAAPVEVFCAAGSAIGKAATSCENDTTSKAGRGTFTDATDSVLGGNTASSPVAGTVEAFSVAGSAVGTSDSDATEDKEVSAGGYNGSRGDGSTGGGNIIQTPVATPVETFGAAGSLVGGSSASASETKTVSSGGDGNTEDDDAVGASNVIATPIAQPVQVFGIGAAGLGHSHGDAEAETDTTAGGKYTGSGKGAVGSGNVLQAASSAPAQVFGIGAAGGGTATGSGDNTSSSAAGGKTKTSGEDGTLSGNVGAVSNSLPAQVHGLGGALGGEGAGTSSNVTDSVAGGDTDSDGTGSSIGGNVVSVPLAGAAGVFGDAAAVAGHAHGDATNDVVSGSGGSTETAGDEGSLAGNVVSAQALPVAQVFGNAATLGGFADGTGENTADIISGGDISTSGDSGSLSGNVFDVPAAAIAQIFGNALSLGGDAVGTGDNTTVGTVGGSAESTGGQAAQLPVGALVQVFNFSGPLLGQALGTGTNVTDVQVGDGVQLLDLVLDGSQLPADGLPSLDGMPMPLPAQQRSDVPDVTPALMPRPVQTDLPTLPVLGDVTQLPEITELPGLPGEGTVPALPAAPEVGT
ncbi:MAG: beta strand repeat-containing protein, partial [Thermocrispum sp.]